MNKSFMKKCYESDYNYQIHHIIGTKTQDAYSVNLHYDTTLTIAYFKKANGNIKIEGNNYNFSDGDIIILNYNELHSANIQSDYCERITIYINESIYKNYNPKLNELLNVFYNRKGGQDNLITASVVKEYGLNTLIEEILEFTKQQDTVSDLIAFGKITEFLKVLNKAFLKPNFTNLQNVEYCPVVAQTIKYVCRHFTEEISCESIAKQMNISRYHLSRLFKENVGASLWDYIINRRLLYFNDLIRENYSLETASNKAGFNNYSNFYRLYKNRMGITPSEFKNHITKNN